ncbi:pre-60S factor rei1 [Tilletia horrida]|uniref:Pre-60S factor rei1 n=1 Tax=Tilletia horrida TaxID=155126 RepID=A0AAN6GVX3_9BASI|nr:pre-60S factor rei1 [Tilletia horrida]KAK0567899.1 pre-60S factor rei1 [Tilletia horrida]
MAATATTVALGENGQPLYTCLSCNIAFPNAQDQRGHYRSDWHRYNAKRKLAQLPPIRQDVFQQKVAAASGSSSTSAAAPQPEAQASGSAAANGSTEMQTDAASSTSSTRNRCDVCNKSFASDKVLADHTNSKKHKETALAASLKQAHALSAKASATNPAKEAASSADSTESKQPASAPSSSLPLTLNVPENATEEEINALIDAKVASATRIDPARACLFCTTHTTTPPSIEATLDHMARAHGFYLPEREYLIDLPGLMTYLADKITVGNICLYCNARGKSFASLEAVRKHMLDKSHCKIAYTSEQDQMELSDFYDFSSSYPDEEGDEDWEDMDGVQGEGASDEDMEDDDGEEDAAANGASAPQQLSARVNRTKNNKSNQATFGDTEYELVLPSGTRLGHRALRRYYNQTLWTTPATQVQQSFNQRLITAASGGGAGGNGGPNSLIVPNRGGKQNAVVARSKGQKKEAMRHIREFRDITRKEAQKTRAAFQNNNQKHFRDPLLQ